MSEKVNSSHISDSQLNQRLENICAKVKVNRLPNELYSEIFQKGNTKQKASLKTGIGPVCLLTPLLNPLLDRVKISHDFELYTFYNSMRSGFRVVPGSDSLRFEVFKGFGLVLPEAFKKIQPIIQDRYQYSLHPNSLVPNSPYCILELEIERRVGGAIPIAMLLPDAKGYELLYKDNLINIPSIQGVFSYSKKFCKLLGLPMATYGQNIRRFNNPFRISDLQLVLFFSKHANLKSERLQWLNIAENIANLSIDLAGFNGNSHAYAIYVARMVGRLSASLFSHKILHNRLTDHCQNITLNAELTEFDHALKLEDNHSNIDEFISRLCSQIILFANHIRHFATCLTSIGINVSSMDYMNAFAIGVKDRITKQHAEAFLSHLYNDPYCADITLSAHNHYSTQNLKGGNNFISLLRRIIPEVL